MKKYTLMVNGGIGKHICATTMIRQIKETEPDARINVISGYPEVFLHNPKIYRNLHHTTSYVYDDYIKETEFRNGDPYSMLEYYENKKHINNLYPLAYRFKKENDNIYPEIYLGKNELRSAQDFKSKSKQPIITIQVTGGNQGIGQSKDPRQLTGRDLLQPAAQKIVDICLRENFNVVQVALNHEMKLKDTIVFNRPFRDFMSLIPVTAGHIGIDSSMMHAVAAFKKPSLIFWGCTNDTVLGYPYMTNVHRDKCPTPMCSRPHTGMPDLVPEGSWICPHNLVCQGWTGEEIEKNVMKFLDELKKGLDTTTRIPLSQPKCEGLKRNLINLKK